MALAWRCARRVLVDGRLKVGHAGEYAAADALVRDVAKEALDHVQPG